MRVVGTMVLIWFCGLPLVGGCAGYTPTIRSGDGYKSTSAYLFGRFKASGGGGSIGFEIRCRDGKTYTITFSEGERLQMIEVNPSVCQLDRVVWGSPNGPLREMATFRLLRNEFVDAGGVYYLGDFVGRTTSDATFMLFYTEWHNTWKFGASRNDYAGASAELKQTFPGFVSVSTEDRSTIAPARGRRAATH